MQKRYAFVIILLLIVSATPNTWGIRTKENDFVLQQTSHKPLMQAFSIDGDAELNSTVASNGWPGDGSSSNPYVISGYRFNGSRFMIKIFNTNQYILIENNEFSIEGTQGIYLESVNYVTIRNNTFTDLSLSIDFFYSTNIAIVENSFVGDGESIYSEGNSGINVTANLFMSGKQTMESISDMDLIFSSNVITDFMGPADVLYTDSLVNGIVKNNAISGNDGTPLYFDSSDNISVQFNKISGFSYGIYFNSGNDQVIIGNTVSASQSSIRIGYTGKTTVESNVLELSGIDIQGGSKSWDLQMTNNTLDGKEILYISALTSGSYSAQEYGQIILLNTSNLVFDGISFGDGYGRKLIGLYSEFLTIKNSIFKNGAYGIFLRYTHNSSIFNNQIFNISATGIYVYVGSENEIYNNQIYDTDLGIYLFNSEGNSIHHNSISRVRMGMSTSAQINSSFTENLIQDTDTTGIKLYNSQNSVLANNRAINSEGISVQNSESVIIANNSYTNSGLDISGSNIKYWRQSVKNETVDGLPVLYVNDTYNFGTIDGTQYGQVILVNVTFATINNFNQDGIYRAIQIAYSDSIDIVKATITNIIDRGIYLYNTQNWQILSSQIDGGYYGIFSKEYGGFLNATIIENSDYGLYTASSITINNSYFRNIRFKGAWLDSASGSIINNSQFINTFTGLWTSGDSISLVNNIFVNSSWTPSISTNPILSTESNNTVNGLPLLYVYNEATPSTIQNVGEVVLDTVRNLRIEDVIQVNGATILYVYRSTNISFYNVRGNVSDGSAIEVRNSNNVSLEEVNLTNTSVYGIYLYQSTNISISSSTIINANIGIKGYQSSNININNVWIERTSAIGISITSYSRSITVSNTRVFDSEMTGMEFSIQDSNVTLVNNSIINTGYFALTISGYGMVNATVIGNEFIHYDKYGESGVATIYSSTGYLTIRNNYFSEFEGVDNDGDGYSDVPFDFTNNTPTVDTAPSMYSTYYESLRNGTRISLISDQSGINQTKLTWNDLDFNNISIIYNLSYSTGDGFVPISSITDGTSYIWDMSGFENGTLVTVKIEYSLKIANGRILGSNELTFEIVKDLPASTTSTSSTTSSTSDPTSTSTYETTSSTTSSSSATSTETATSNSTTTVPEKDGGSGLVTAIIVVAVIAGTGGGAVVYIRKRSG